MNHVQFIQIGNRYLNLKHVIEIINFEDVIRIRMTSDYGDETSLWEFTKETTPVEFKSLKLFLKSNALESFIVCSEKETY